MGRIVLSGVFISSVFLIRGVWLDPLGPSQIRGVSLHSPTFYIIQSQFLHLRVVKSFDRNKSDVTHGPPRCQGAHLSCLLYTQQAWEGPCAPGWVGPGCDPVNPLVFLKKWIMVHWVYAHFLRKPQQDKLVHLQKMLSPDQVCSVCSVLQDLNTFTS